MSRVDAPPVQVPVWLERAHESQANLAADVRAAKCAAIFVAVAVGIGTAVTLICRNVPNHPNA